jgi:alanine dehydrogenase
MHQEAGERRDFLPDLVHFLDRTGVDEIVLEEGYGSAMGIDPETYLGASPRARFADEAGCYAKDLVLVLRCPDAERLERLRPGAMFVSMLHYPTRPERVALLLRLGVRAVSLDSVIDLETGHRMVENLEAVGWNGVREAFAQIRRTHPNFDHPGRRPLRVTCLGSGAVGGFAVHAATRYGDRSLREELVAKNVPGVEVTVVDFDLSWHEEYMLERLRGTDLLIDATQRADPSRPVIPNGWIATLPEDAVILDLAADPYDFSVEPPVVKGIEGVPHGDLDRYVFFPDDPAYEALDPRVDVTHRRLALSCYSWPGLDPVGSMRVYGEQVEPILSLLLRGPGAALNETDGSHEERAVAGAEVARWWMTHAV